MSAGASFWIENPGDIELELHGNERYFLALALQRSFAYGAASRNGATVAELHVAHTQPLFRGPRPSANVSGSGNTGLHLRTLSISYCSRLPPSTNGL